MPSDTVKKLASLVDSSVTECKNDEFNTDGPAQADSRGLSDEEACRSVAEEQVHYCNRAGISSELEKDVPNNTRYFIIKSLNHQNIQLSVNKGIWATQVMNEPILDEAFQNSSKVILIFSVNMSGSFQGYAQMMSSVGWRRDSIWSQGGGKNNPWGRSFKVKWLRLFDLSFQKTLHLKNPWNDYKPVKISRDCQELPRDLGESLCELLDGGDGMNVNLERDGVYGGNIPTSIEPFIQDADFNVNPFHMGLPFYPYQHQAEASLFDWPNQRATMSQNRTSVCHGTTKPKQTKPRQVNSRATQGIFTDDDILEMTYEEYLEAHDALGRRLPVAGRSMSLQKSSSSKERSDESQSASSSKKRTYHQSIE